MTLQESTKGWVDEDISGELRTALESSRVDGPTADQLALVFEALTSRLDPVAASKASALKVGAAFGVTMALLAGGFFLVVKDRPVENVNVIDKRKAEPTLRAEVQTPNVASTGESPMIPRVNDKPVINEPVALPSPSAIQNHHRRQQPERPTQSSVDEEVKLVEHMQSEFLAGDVELVLRLANQHEVRFPRGTLDEEREVLRIEALSKIQLGGPELLQRASDFREKYPGSAHLRRVLQAADVIKTAGPSH